jgi:hypothetical protein
MVQRGSDAVFFRTSLIRCLFEWLHLAQSGHSRSATEVVDARECLSALQLSEMLDQQFGENSDFPCGVPTRRPDDEHAARRDGIARHHLDKADDRFTARIVR